MLNTPVATTVIAVVQSTIAMTCHSITQALGTPVPTSVAAV